jgi:monoamine oxidase
LSIGRRRWLHICYADTTHRRLPLKQLKEYFHAPAQRSSPYLYITPYTPHQKFGARYAGALFEEDFDYQATMFQPMGGIGHIPHAFAKKLDLL